MRRGALPDELSRNLRYDARVLRKSPSFRATAVLTLAPYISANAAILSVVDAVLLRPLPYPEPERLGSVVTFMRAKGMEGISGAQTGTMWEAVRDHARC